MYFGVPPRCSTFTPVFAASRALEGTGAVPLRCSCSCATAATGFTASAAAPAAAPLRNPRRPTEVFLDFATISCLLELFDSNDKTRSNAKTERHWCQAYQHDTETLTLKQKLHCQLD